MMILIIIFFYKTMSNILDGDRQYDYCINMINMIIVLYLQYDY